MPELLKKKKNSEDNLMIQNILSISSWLMEPDYLKNFLIQVHQKSEMSTEDIEKQAFIFIEGKNDDDDKKPYAMDGDIAIISLSGPMMKRAKGFFAILFGIRGMVGIGEDFKAAMADKDVAGVFLDIDSPGGTVDGTMDLANIIYEGRGQKPILSFADGQMTSAAQWIGSAADYTVIANETTRLGSVGVYGVHFDFTDRAKQLGIKPTVFSAGDFKRIGNELEHLTKTDKAHIQKDFDYIHGQFIDGMSRNMGIAAKDLDSDLKQAKVFIGSQAIAVGLGAEIMNRDKAMTLLKSVTNGENDFDKHKSRKKENKAKGGVNSMDRAKELEENVVDLKAEIVTLKKDIEQLSKENDGLKTVNAKLDELMAKVEELEKSESALADQVKDLQSEIDAKKAYVDIGTTSITQLKEDIQKISVQVEGKDFDKDLLDKQLTALGDDYSALTAMHTKLESQRGKLLKAGDLKPDEVLDDSAVDQKDKQGKEELGASLVPKHIRLVT